MIDSASSDEFWPRRCRRIEQGVRPNQADILETLASTHWDLVVADTRLGSSGGPSGASEPPPNESCSQPRRCSLPDGLSIQDAAVVDWRRDQLVVATENHSTSCAAGAARSPLRSQRAERNSTIGGVPVWTPARQQRSAVLFKPSIKSAAPAMVQQLVAFEPRDDASPSLDATDKEDEAAGVGLARVSITSAEKVSVVAGRALQEIGQSGRFEGRCLWPVVGPTDRGEGAGHPDLCAH